MGKDKSFTPELKMQIVMQSFKNELSMDELAQKYETSEQNIKKWKEQFLKNAHLAFTPFSKQDIETLKEQNTKLEKLLQKLNRQTSEEAQKLQSLDNSIKKQLIDANARISIIRQCEMIELNRQTLYYKAKPNDGRDIAIMQKIREIYASVTPNKGYRAIHKKLVEQGFKIGANKVNKLINLLSEQNLLKPKQKN